MNGHLHYIIMNKLDIIYDEGKVARTYTMETDQGKLISIVPTSYHLITQQAGKMILQPEPKTIGSKKDIQISDN